MIGTPKNMFYVIMSVTMTSSAGLPTHVSIFFQWFGVGYSGQFSEELIFSYLNIWPKNVIGVRDQC